MPVLPRAEEKIDATIMNACTVEVSDSCESNSVSSGSDSDENTIVINRLPKRPIPIPAIKPTREPSMRNL